MKTFTGQSGWKAFRRYCAGAMLCTAGAVNAQGIVGTVEPVSPVVRFIDRDASATLHLVNPGADKIVARFGVWPLQLKGGTGLAQVRIVAADQKTTLTQIELPATAGGRQGTVDVQIEVKGMDAPGTYEGSIDILPAAASLSKSKVNLSFIRQALNFDPTVRGAGVVNGVLTFKPQSSNDNVAWVTVENPKCW